MSSRSHTTGYSVLPYAGESTHSIVARLNQEWDNLRWDPAEWVVGAPVLDVVLAGIPLDPDHQLNELIRACQKGYESAGRVIVQALLPKLILMSHVFPYPPITHLVSALWIRISHYPLQRRPRCVAANLVLDAKKDVLAEYRTKITVCAMPERAFAITTESDTVPTADQVLAAARNLGLASPESLTIVEMVYIEGRPKDQVAQAYAMTTEAVRQRCSDTVKRLRENRDLLLDMW